MTKVASKPAVAVNKAAKSENPVFGFITTEANNYKTRGVPLSDNWEWKMFEHIKRSFLYKNSKFSEGENDGNRPFKNIVRPILNVAYRAEGFDVKDIVAFVDDENNYDKSFFVKKFAQKWGIDNNLDDFIDEMVEGYIDYGLTLVKRVKGKVPEAVPLQRIAFCDQTNVLGGPICEFHPMTIDDINEMRGKWNEDAINLAIEQARAGKMVVQADGQEAKTPGKYIEVFELHGTFPETWLGAYDSDVQPPSSGETEDGAPSVEPTTSSEYTDETKYLKQLHLVAYYYDQNNNKCGIHFFKGPEKKQIYKAKKRDPIFGRACGMGGVEELFDPQQWTNFDEIQIQEMLEVASLVLIQTANTKGGTKNVLDDLVKGQVIENEGEPYSQVQIQIPNKALFDQAVDRWNNAAQAIGSANEALLGQAPAAGTPFSLQALVVQQGFGLHDYRKGKLATFMGEIYREWILQELVDDMKAGSKWLASLDADEMQSLVDNIVNIQAWKMMKDHLLRGQLPTEDQKQAYMQQVRDSFMKDSKKFLKIVEQELDEIPVDVEVDVAGKQYDLHDRAEKLTNIFRQIVQYPQVFQIPGMADLFNEIIESSGFSPIDFSQMTAPRPAAPAATPAAPAAPAPTPTPSAITPSPQPVAA